MSLAEIVVAMVILMIVLAMMSRVLVDGASTKDSINGDATVSITADQTTDQLASDLRTAESPARRNATEAGLVAGFEDGNDLRDVARADPHVLQLRVDADADADTECVQYQVDAQGSLWRMVKSDWTTCGDASIVSQRRTLPGLGAKDAETSPSTANGFDMNYVPGADAPQPAVTFQYVIAVPGAGGVCTKQSLATVTGTALSRIIAVTASITPAVLGRNDVSTTSYNQTIALRARAGASYRRAIGCAAGIS